MSAPSPSLTIYKSSAGSGKTFTLVKEYLKLCLPRPDRFRNVVAITFTNAAAAEMKERILLRLKGLIDGSDTVLPKLLLEEGLSPQDLANAEKLLRNILFNYSGFTVGTIDSFFHKILRAFNKELDLPMDFEIFLDTKEALDYAVENFLYRSYMNSSVHQLLMSYIREKISGGHHWGIQGELYKIAGELVKDESMLLQPMALEDFQDFIHELRGIRDEFEDHMDKLGRTALNEIEGLGLNIDDFKYGKSGPMQQFVYLLRTRRDYELRTRFVKGASDENEWIKKGHPHGRMLEEAVLGSLQPLAQEVILYRETHYPRYVSAKEVLKTVYTFAVYEELRQVLDEYRLKHNQVLVSDFTRILARHLLKEDISFIYGKLGSRYDHFLIDEFQDTSSLQWLCLKPLVENAIAHGSDCMVVGDSKQAIYRWRGGEVELIERQLSERDFPQHFHRRSLSRNFRSRHTIIDFNNKFFHSLARHFEKDEPEFELLRQIFEDVAQEYSGAPGMPGYVEVQFFKKEGRSWEAYTEKARTRLLDTVENLLKEGYRKKDITILVRDKKDAADAARTLFNAGVDFVTQDSLYLDQSPAVRLLLSVLNYLNDPRSDLARTQIVFLYLRYFRPEHIETEIPFTDLLRDFLVPEDGLFVHTLPKEFSSRLFELSIMPVYELVEELIRIFELNRQPDAYLQRFQDVVLEYALSKTYGIQGFLADWKSQHFTVVLPEDQDAVQIMTIHKSKGLEFPVVIMPFADWDFRSGRPGTLWVNADEPPFDRFRRLPVTHSATLADSLFEPDYNREEALSAIDNLNLLYVAFTRARERMYITTEQCPKLDGTFKNISQLINASLLDGPADGETCINFGELTPPQIEEEPAGTYKIMGEYPISNWRDFILPQAYTSSPAEELYQILTNGNPLRLVQRTAPAGLFAEQESATPELDRIMAYPGIIDFYSQQEQVVKPPVLLLPGYGAYSPNKINRTEKGAYSLLRIAHPESDTNIEQKALSDYKTALYKQGWSITEALLVFSTNAEVLSL